jgi:hypothetical protein
VAPTALFEQPLKEADYTLRVKNEETISNRQFMTSSSVRLGIATSAPVWPREAARSADLGRPGLNVPPAVLRRRLCLAQEARNHEKSANDTKKQRRRLSFSCFSHLSWLVRSRIINADKDLQYLDKHDLTGLAYRIDFC